MTARPTSLVRLHPHQRNAIAHAVAAYNSPATPGPGRRLCITSPTGTGKSYIAAGILQAIPDSVFIAPTQEILNDMARKGVPTARCWTVKKLHNALMLGLDLNTLPAVVLDEAHHVVDDTHQTTLTLLPDTTWVFGVTGTFFRGTPKSTAELHLFWGEPYAALDYPTAAIERLIALPTCETVPLVDDDQFTVTGGDFEIRRITSEYRTKSDDAAGIMLQRGWVVDSNTAHPTLTRPTIVGVSSSEQASYIAESVKRVCHIPATVVNALTTDKTRQAVFAATLRCECVLIHINIVSEGVDLALRNYLDLSPTLSPRLWAQRIGRIMRPTAPGEPAPEYVCTNRNLERHAHLLQGCVPDSVLALAQQAFPTPAERSVRRAMGLESLGALRSDSIRLTSGLTVAFYNISTSTPAGRTAYICLLHPAKSEIVWMSREDTVSATPNKYGGRAFSYGKWAVCPPPTALKGYGAAPASPLQFNQRRWWDSSAAEHGLDVSQDMTARRFALLPALADIGASL